MTFSTLPILFFLRKILTKSVCAVSDILLQKANLQILASKSVSNLEAKTNAPLVIRSGISNSMRAYRLYVYLISPSYSMMSSMNSPSYPVPSS